MSEKKYQLDHKIKQAQDFEAQGKLLHSVQIYNSLIEENPDLIELYFRLSSLYEQLGNLNSASNLLRQIFDKDPENKDVRLYFGQFFLRNSKWEEAIEILSYILPQEEPTVSFFVGYSHFMLNEFELAKNSFLNFISFEKQSELVHEAYIYLAKIELKLKNYDNTLMYAKKAEIMYSNFWELNKIYAETYYNMGMFAHAVMPIEKAIKLNIEEPSVYELAGKIYLKLSEFAKAEKNFLKYIERIEDVSSDIYTKLAEACLKSQKTKDAIAYFDIALKLDPENQSAITGKNQAASLLNNSVVSDG